MIRLHNLHDSYVNVLTQEDRELLYAYITKEQLKEPHETRIGEGFKLRIVKDLNEKVSPLRLLALIVHDHCAEMIKKFYDDRNDTFSASIISQDLCLEKTEIHVTEIDSWGYTPLRAANFNRSSSSRCFVIRYVLENPSYRQMAIYPDASYAVNQDENSLCIFPASPLFQYREALAEGLFKFIDFYLSYADRDE